MHSVVIKQRLEKLDKSVLADALIQLADLGKEAEALLKRLISTPAESVTLFKTKLSGIKRRHKFVFRAGSRTLSYELEGLIKLIAGDAIPPDDALKCLVTFFESDLKIMNMCDDSNGNVSGVFRYAANQAFIKKAKELAEQAPLLRMTKRLMKENDYGVRDSLFESTAEYLDEASLRKLFTHLEKQYEELKQSDPEPDQSYGKVFNAKIRLQTAAKQLNDPELFDSLCKDDDGKIHDYKMVEVAECYLNAGQAETALEKLNSLKTIPFNAVYDHEKLLLKIHASMGNNDEIKAMNIDAFLGSPSLLTYNAMQDHIKDDEATKILEQCLLEQENNPSLSAAHVSFLLDLNQHQCANNYLLMRADQIDGDDYYTYPKMASLFVSEGFPMAATHIYRALLTSLLERSQTKAYPYGARYLKTLTELSSKITDWKNHPTHEKYHKSIQEKHARKKSFWKHVNENS